MKLSTKGRYGVKAMLDLALHNKGEPVSLKSIAERQNISENYLEQLFASLRKAGHVKSVRGAQGGYILAHEPKDITVGDILRTLEGSLAPVDCVLEEDPLKCANSKRCATKSIWLKLRDSVNEVVDSISLQDLVNDYNEAENQGFVYHI